MWPDLLMRILPMGAVPFLYIVFLHLPLSFLGLTLRDAPQQLVIGLVVGVAMAAFAVVYRILFVGPWFRRVFSTCSSMGQLKNFFSVALC